MSQLGARPKEIVFGRMQRREDEVEETMWSDSQRWSECGTTKLMVDKRGTSGSTRGGGRVVSMEVRLHVVVVHG